MTSGTAGGPRTLSWLAMRIRGAVLLTLCALMSSGPAAAQSFNSVGTRAQGMGGAFVGMSNDASAVYWNPGGLARGAYVSLLIDGGSAESAPEDGLEAGNGSNWMLAFTTPALGLSYYRLRSTTVRPFTPGLNTGTYVVDSLVTHHAGITVGHSLTDGVAVGATLKVLRGEASSVTTTAARPEDLLDDWEVMDRSGSAFDVDVGIMASSDFGSVGVTARNLTEPSFETGSGLELGLQRQVRGGASVVLLPPWRLSADVDFTKSRGPLGDVRQVAIGTEAQLSRRFAARGGVNVNTTGDRGRTPAWSAGASFALMGSALVDAQVTTGSDETLRGWSVAGRIVF